MKERLSHRERFLLAVRNLKPDRVPACPDLSNMVPCRLTGKPFWDIYLNNNPPLWKAYLAAARKYDLDGRMIYGGIKFKYDKPPVPGVSTVLSRTDERIHIRYTHDTPHGQLTREAIYTPDNSPATVNKLIKDLPRDLEAFKCMMPVPIGYDAQEADVMRKEAGEDAVFTLSVGYPGFHGFHDIFEGGLEQAVASFLDYPELFEELRLLIHNTTVRKAEMMLEYKPDILYLGGSGTLTLSTPAWVRQFCLPTIKEVTKMAKQAGVPTMLHSCGKSRLLVEMFANETDLGCMNPLEAPPMGDADLAEVKQKFGARMALSGNIHTTDVMLRGTVQDVDNACRKAIEDAGAGGGFILMSGDQCGRDTPDENIFAFVAAARKYGQY